MANPVIKVSNLSKTFRTSVRREGVRGALRDFISREYRDVHAVDKVSFDVHEREMIGFIGPNGAGKSTTIKMLTGILKPTAGDMQVLGFHPFQDRRRYTHHIGVVFGQRTQLWWDIAVIESLRLLANVYKIPRAQYTERLDTLIEILELRDFLKIPVRKLSLGQRIRCDMAASLIHNPKILFLDEPTIGLDAVVKVKVRQFLREINNLFNTTVILTTHDLYEIEELCKRIVIIDKGRLVYDGALAAIKELPGLTRTIKVDFTGEVPLAALKEVLPAAASVRNAALRRAEVLFDPRTLPPVTLIRKIVENFEIADLQVSDPDIEEVVMKIYQEGRV